MPAISKKYVANRLEARTRAGGEEKITCYLNGYRMYLIRYMYWVMLECWGNGQGFGVYGKVETASPFVSGRVGVVWLYL
jgi:hypothetical protein